MRFGRVFLSAAHALGIEAASFASLQRDAVTGAGAGCGDGSGDGDGDGIRVRGRERGREAGTGCEQRYSGKPDGIAGTH